MAPENGGRLFYLTRNGANGFALGCRFAGIHDSAACGNSITIRHRVELVFRPEGKRNRLGRGWDGVEPAVEESPPMLRFCHMQRRREYGNPLLALRARGFAAAARWLQYVFRVKIVRMRSQAQ
jgi:hypothetical protein